MLNLNQAMAQAEQLRLQGRLSDAESIYQQIIQQHPDADYAYHGLGLVALDAGNITLAIDLINRAITYNDKIAFYHSNLGEICRRSGRLEAAVASGERATRLAPQEAASFYNLGLAYSDQQQLDEAIRCYQKTVKLQPRHGLAYNNLGAMLERRGDAGEAEKCYAKAVAINPEHTEAQNNLGVMYNEQGQIEKARACFEASLAASPYFVDAHYNLSGVKTYQQDDPHLSLLETMAVNSEQYPIDARIKLYFAFGKALEDTGEYDRSFAAYTEGNYLQRSLVEYRSTQEINIMNEAVTTFTKTFYASHIDDGFDDASPIFIVGMPRSGSSLLEQVLDSHPQIYGAGEQKLLGEITNQFLGEKGLTYFSKMTSDELKQLGQAYIKALRALAPKDTLLITDKMPANFFYIGVIKAILPNAKIIHSMRNPLDSCFSCYGKFFKDAINFSYNLKELADYYARYMRLMEHWHHVIPKQNLLDVSYERFVAGFESETKRILDFIGVAWDEQCLSFHKNSRRVKTASIAQIQKPLYQSSVHRASHFSPYLSELKMIVGDGYDECVKKWCDGK
jgi:tetratricopeptide (TPR) repeat protein